MQQELKDELEAIKLILCQAISRIDALLAAVLAAPPVLAPPAAPSVQPVRVTAPVEVTSPVQVTSPTDSRKRSRSGVSHFEVGSVVRVPYRGDVLPAKIVADGTWTSCVLTSGKVVKIRKMNILPWIPSQREPTFPSPVVSPPPPPQMTPPSPLSPVDRLASTQPSAPSNLSPRAEDDFDL